MLAIITSVGGSIAVAAQPAQPVECASLPAQNACKKYAGPPYAPFRKNGGWRVCEWHVVESQCVELAYRVASKVLQPGDSGPDVFAIQSALREVGYQIEADGKFGNSTMLAVKEMQAKAQLPVDGKVGPKTLELLKNGMVK